MVTNSLKQLAAAGEWAAAKSFPDWKICKLSANGFCLNIRLATNVFLLILNYPQMDFVYKCFLFDY